MPIAALTFHRQRYAHQRQAIAQAYAQHRNPKKLLRQNSQACDQLLQALAKHQPLPAGACLVAVGGYGRQEMYPQSDVDLLILLARTATATDKELLEQWITAVWDLGLRLGHSVRTISQCQALAATDVTVETSLLEARWLAGNNALFQLLTKTMRSQLNAHLFFQAKQTEMRQRHQQFDDTPYALEPNCKESPGALRDLQLLLWLAKAAGYGDSWSAVMRQGALTAAEYKELHRAERTLRRIRIALHFHCERPEDRLLFSLQPMLAADFGYGTDNPQQASEQFMQRYYRAARTISLLTTLLMQAIEERLFEGPKLPLSINHAFQIVNNRLDIKDEAMLAHNPALIFEAFLYRQQNLEFSGMTANTLRAIWHARHQINASFRQQRQNQKNFLKILKQPHGVADALYDLMVLDILPRYIPPFQRIIGKMQHDLFHVYTVDEHILKVVRNLRRFSMADYAHEYPQASGISSDFDAPWLLVIAALFHDIAKGRGGNHSVLGAQEAQHFCQQHQLSGEDTALVTFLVRHHLLMSHVAQKQDLSDPRVITDFAQIVPDKRSLDALYLLTIADIRATNPTVWTSWKGKLLDDLYQRTLLALDGERPNLQALLAQRRQQAREKALALGVSEASCEQLWRSLDVAYFMRHEAQEIAWHAEHIAHRVDDHKPLVRARVLGHNEALQIMIWQPDKQGLFAQICEYLDQNTLNVQDARIHTSKHGWALDSFVVIGRQTIQYQDIIGAVQRELAQHLAQEWTAPTPASNGDTRHAPDYRLTRQSRIFPIAPRLDLRRDADHSLWRLSIVCMDAPSLLYRLACVFAAHDINLKMAKIHTLGERVEDIFLLQADHFVQGASRLRFERAILSVLNHLPHTREALC